MENIDNLARVYFIAKNYVIQKGFSDEIDWQEQVSFSDLTAKTFLKEYSWVVLASGMSDKVVSKVFPKINAILCNWNDLEYIARNYKSLEEHLLRIFNNKLKISAILDTSIKVYSVGFEKIKSQIQNKGLMFLKTFKFIGDTTCYHLAKNIGLDFAKPDRHLLRISNKIGFDSPHTLCKLISDYISEKIQVVDLVLWRYATLDNNYERKLDEIKHSLSHAH
ncbi:MAG TPA: hypothetical protein P5228_05100 [Bacteroidales bacterium]|nr:hypothetical protein [Bacteroidales bacterium]